MRTWKTYQKKLIRQHLARIRGNESFIVWQQIHGRRVQYMAVLTKLEPMIRIELASKDLSDYGFDSGKPFFVHVKSNDLIFRKDTYQQNGRFLEFSLPGEIQMREKRKNDRFTYLYQDHKNITVESELRDIKDPTKPVYTMSCVVLDVSISGASFVAGDEQVKNFQVGENIFLLNLTDQDLPSPFKTRITYISPYKVDDKNLSKVGIEFVYELDSISYKSITSIVEKKQRRIRGLNPGRYCGLDFEDQVAKLNKIETENKQLAANIRDNLEYLDKLRYMTTQMKIEFLKEIKTELLATALRLSSKELIYELMTEVTAVMQEEFLDKLAAEKPASGICKAQDQVVAFIRQKEGAGEFVLDPKAFITYV